MPSKLISWIPRQYRKAISRFGNFLWKQLISIISIPYWFFTGVLPAFLTVLGFWWGKRDWRKLLYGFPSLIMLGIVVYFIIGISASGGPSEKSLRYEQAGLKAAKNQQWAEAKLYWSRAIELGRNDPKLRFEMAKAAQKDGDVTTARIVARSVCPDDRAVYAPAHVWRATEILSQQGLQQEAVKLAVTHLDHALSLNPRNQLAQGLMGTVLFDLGLFEKSISFLEPVADLRPAWALMLIKAYANTEKSLQAKSWGDRTAAEYEKILALDSSDVDSRLDLGELHLTLEDFNKSAQVIAVGIQTDDDPRLKAAMSQIYVAWADHLLAQRASDKTAVFESLAKAMEFDPNQPIIFDRMMQLIRSDYGTNDEVTEYLRSNIASGKAAGMSHLILGTALFEEDEEAAGFHLRRAIDLLPSGPVVANNYAWYLARSEQGDAEIALKLINGIVKQFPDNVEFRDTRGHVLLRLNNWEQAISDLEASLKLFPDRQTTHEGLAKAYSELGMKELSEKHRQKAVPN